MNRTVYFDILDNYGYPTIFEINNVNESRLYFQRDGASSHYKECVCDKLDERFQHFEMDLWGRPYIMASRDPKPDSM